MVVKFFSNKKGGSTKAIDYLLNEREADGTARVLKGNPSLTKDIINTIMYKQKVCVGCLSFEEENIDEDLKYKLIEDFEKHLLPSLSDNQFNILWVEHTDKGRLELNFLIPKIELTTKKSLQPYYHYQDLPRIEKWQDYTNIKHMFTNPKDPSKQRTLQGASKQINLQKDYQKLDELLHELVSTGQINNRIQLVELLRNNQIEVNRESKDYISAKLPQSKKARRLKGGIYSEQFTSIGEFERISKESEQRIDKYNQRDTQAELTRLEQELGKYTQRKAKELTTRYATSRKEENNVDNHIDRHDYIVSGDGVGKLYTSTSYSKTKKLANSSKNAVPVSRQKLYKDSNERTITEQRQENNLHKNRRAIDDRIRAATIGRIRKKREDKFKAYEEARRARETIHRELISNARELQIRARKLSEQSNQYYEKFEYIRKLFKKLIVNFVKIKNDVKEKIENLLEKDVNNVINTTKKTNIHKCYVIFIYALCQLIDLKILLV